MRSDEHWQDAVVLAAKDLSPTVRGLALRPEAGVMPWTVGSHLRVQVRIGERDDIRHYSLVGLPQASRADGVYRIAVKRAEPGRGGSRFMAALQPGFRVRIAGPDNHFELPLNAPHTLLVAAGIGITPILGMALTLATRGASLQMAYAVRSADEMVFGDDLRTTLGARLQTFVDAEGQRLDLAAQIAALPLRAQMLICGPVPMLQAAQAAWADAGRPSADLRFETFGASGNAPAQPFWVQVPRQNLRVQVPADRSLLEVLADNGVAVLSDCRRGECGLCAMDVLGVQGRIDHRDVFFSAAEKQEGHKLCACVSRVYAADGEATLVLDSAWRPDTLHAKAA